MVGWYIAYIVIKKETYIYNVLAKTKNLHVVYGYPELLKKQMI